MVEFMQPGETLHSAGPWPDLKNRGDKSYSFLSACVPELCVEWLETKYSSDPSTRPLGRVRHSERVLIAICVQVRSAATIMLSWL